MAAKITLNSANQKQPVITADELDQPTPQQNMTMEQQLRAAIEQDFQDRKAMQDAERNAVMAKLQQPVVADLSPTMGLIASMAGDPNVAKSYKAPEQTDVASALQQLAGNKRQMTQDRISNLKTLIQNKRDANNDARMNMQEKRLAQTVHRGVLRTIDTDPIIRKRMEQFNNLGNALQAVEKADKVPVQQLTEMQQAVRGNMGIKGTSTGDERHATMLTSLGFSMQQALAFLNGTPSDIAKDDEIMKHVRNLAKIERQNVAQQAVSELDAAAAGQESFYDEHPNLKKDLHNKLAKSLQRFDTSKEELSYNLPPKSPSASPSLGEAVAAPPKKILSPAEYFQQKGK